MLFQTYTELKNDLSSEDFKEIEEMSIPDDVQHIKDLWTLHIDYVPKTEYEILQAMIMIKLYTKCKQSCPEYFI